MIKAKVDSWSFPLTKWFNNDLVIVKKRIPITQESIEVPVKIGYYYNPVKNTNMRVPVGPLKYKILKVLREKEAV